VLAAEAEAGAGEGAAGGGGDHAHAEGSGAGVNVNQQHPGTGHGTRMVRRGGRSGGREILWRGGRRRRRGLKGREEADVRIWIQQLLNFLQRGHIHSLRIGSGFIYRDYMCELLCSLNTIQPRT
jgi:hypothetical protein